MTINEKQLCVGGRQGEDSCNGDSGGPLMTVQQGEIPRWFVLGIVSYGALSCGEKDIPAIYTKVAAYLNWILDTIWKSPRNNTNINANTNQWNPIPTPVNLQDTITNTQPPFQMPVPTYNPDYCSELYRSLRYLPSWQQRLYSYPQHNSYQKSTYNPQYQIPHYQLSQYYPYSPKYPGTYNSKRNFDYSRYYFTPTHYQDSPISKRMLSFTPNFLHYVASPAKVRTTNSRTIYKATGHRMSAANSKVHLV